MEQERIEEGLQHCLLLDDFDFFKVIVNHLKEEKLCLAALYLARGFGLDWEERYNKYFKLAVEALYEIVLNEDWMDKAILEQLSLNPSKHNLYRDTSAIFYKIDHVVGYDPIFVFCCLRFSQRL